MAEDFTAEVPVPKVKTAIYAVRGRANGVLSQRQCYWAGLARQELRVMVETLLARLPDLALAGPVERLRSTFIGGIKHMPVRFPACAPPA